MFVLKTGGKVFGAKLTAAEQKALDIEIRKQLTQIEETFQQDQDAMLLWILHEEFGFGMKRLRRFYERMTLGTKELMKYYQFDNSDMDWLYRHKCKEHLGIDVEEWDKEIRRLLRD